MKQYVLSLSYGKDSLACLGAIEQLGLPLDRIVHAEVWFDDNIPADLPPMVEFKKKADAIIKERYGIAVEHYFAIRGGQSSHTQSISTDQKLKASTKATSKASRHKRDVGVRNSKLATVCRKSYKDIFYRVISRGEHKGEIYGFPIRGGNWCTSELKTQGLERAKAEAESG